jgi:ATP-binding cassette subfamily B (MDR/TAP) protein 6
MGFYGLLFPSEKPKVETPFWFDWEKFKKLTPFLWPNTTKLQVLVVACLALLAAGRVVNVLVPVQYKVVIDALSSPDISDKRPYYAWGAILVFATLRFLQGGVGVISTLQSFLWIPIGQFNTREISVQMFEHLHNLSLQFHLNRKTGEVLRGRHYPD